MLHVIRPLVSKSVSKKMQLLKSLMQPVLFMLSMLMGTPKMQPVSSSLKRVKRFEFEIWQWGTCICFPTCLLSLLHLLFRLHHLFCLLCLVFLVLL
jgi:hypothetical protein